MTGYLPNSLMESFEFQERAIASWFPICTHAITTKSSRFQLGSRVSKMSLSLGLGIVSGELLKWQVRAPEVHLFKSRKVLAWRELARFFRQRNRVVGAIGTPLFMWLLFGFGLDQSFSVGNSPETETSFLEYYFPGSLVLILMFTAIYTTISVIEDRQAGFLQGVLVAPISRQAMVAGKVLGGSIIAMIQGMLFLLAALFLDVDWTIVQYHWWRYYLLLR